MASAAAAGPSAAPVAPEPSPPAAAAAATEPTAAAGGAGPAPHADDDDAPTDLGPAPSPANFGATRAAPSAWTADDDALLKQFYAEVNAASRDAEVARILGSFKLNPFEHLSLRFDATPEDISRAFRKLSLLVHPDKCSNPRAREAFDALGTAQEYLLDTERRTDLVRTLANIRTVLRKERRKATKHDVLVALAAAEHERGHEGVLDDYEKTDEFHEAWKRRAQKLLADLEWKRRKMTLRIKDEEARVTESIAKDKADARRDQDHAKEWETGRENRIGSWRDFTANKKAKAGDRAAKTSGETRPPKLKVEDPTHSYIQRPANQAMDQGAKAKAPVRAFRGGPE